MPQSLSEIIIHLIFSTKNRESLIRPGTINNLHAYLATVVRDCNWECYRVGGVSDHVHLALRQPRTETLADLVGHIKRNSTKWMHKEQASPTFSWQSGYGAFSISPPHLPDLVRYIENQESHHKTHTFQDEFRHFLEKYKIPYDERYVWD